MNAEEPKGVLGDGALRPGKYNMALVRRAIRNGYPIKKETRQKLIEQMETVMECGESDRDKIAAARVIVAADSVNVKRESAAMPQQHEHEHHHTGAVVHATVRGELMNDPTYLEYLRNHQGDGDSSPVCEGGGRTLEVSAAPEVPGQSANGHLNGKGRH